MMNLVLSEKMPLRRRKESLQTLSNKLHETASGLETHFEILGLTKNGWPSIRISGPDTEIYTEILKRDIGFAVTKIESLEPHSITKAFVEKIQQERNTIQLDIGFDPDEAINVEYHASDLRSQLFDGQKIPFKAMVSRYCLNGGFPLEVRISDNSLDQGALSVVLSDSQVSSLTEWRDERFERLILQGAFFHEVEKATKDLKLARDLADMAELSLMTSLLTCKLGTQARGLVPKLGPLLRSATFCVFQSSSLVNSAA
ncbi:MAG: DUF2110 family protein [archaeon]